MFGFGKKKEEPKKSKRSQDFEDRKAQNRAQLGAFLLGEGSLDDAGGPGSVDLSDNDLEAELAQLLGSGLTPKTNVSPLKRQPAVAASHSDPEDAPEDEDDDYDLDDPELEAELGNILGGQGATEISYFQDDKEDKPEDRVEVKYLSGPPLVSLLEARIILYKEAKAVAENANEGSKVRRFQRGLGTLEDLRKGALKGLNIKEEEIPPEVSVKVAGSNIVESLPMPLLQPSTTVPPMPEKPPTPLKPQETPPEMRVSVSPCAPIPPPKKTVSQITPPPKEPPPDYPSTDEGVVPSAMTVLTSNPEVEERLKAYKLRAVNLKRNGETGGALKYLKLSKALEKALVTGEVIDLIHAFPPLQDEEEEVGSAVVLNNDTDTFVSQRSVPFKEEQQTAPQPQQASHSTGDSSGGPSDGGLFGSPPIPIPKTIEEALLQRLEKYRSEAEKAAASGNSSKVRRMGRIVKQYEDALSNYKTGKPVEWEDLPTPPGFAPIPMDTPGSHPLSLPAQGATVTPITQQGQGSPQKKLRPSPTTATTPTVIGTRGKMTLQEKQLREVLSRQKSYRDAALEAKKRGDLGQAKEYLRTSKGFDSLVQASKAGLPVDLKTMPAAPGALAILEAETFEVISADDCLQGPQGSSSSAAEVWNKLEEDLKSQLKMTMRMRDHFKAIGDVASANRFEGLALETKRDLDALRLTAKSGNNSLPKYHYETRVFSITQVNTELKSDEIEVSIPRGIGYKVGSSSDTFLRVELAYPSAEEAQVVKSSIVKDSSDPEYSASWKLSIKRDARLFQRFAHRHGIKVEVWQKNGFLRSSTILGTATVKLQPLESKTVIHEAYDILDGRKVMGKVEVKVQIREPLLTKEIVQKKEKWLVIDRA